MTRMLKTAEPTIVPTPTSPLVMKTPGGRETQEGGGSNERESDVSCHILRCLKRPVNGGIIYVVCVKIKSVIGVVGLYLN